MVSDVNRHFSLSNTYEKELHVRGHWRLMREVEELLWFMPLQEWKEKVLHWMKQHCNGCPPH